MKSRYECPECQDVFDSLDEQNVECINCGHKLLLPHDYLVEKDYTNEPNEDEDDETENINESKD